MRFSKNLKLLLFAFVFESCSLLGFELQAQEVDYLALAKSEYELGHLDVARNAIIVGQRSGSISREDDPEFFYQEGVIKFAIYNLTSLQDQKDRWSRRAKSVFENCIEVDTESVYTAQCKKYLDILENDPNYNVSLAKGEFSIQEYADLVKEGKSFEADEYFSLHLRGSYIFNEELLYWVTRNRYESDKIRYGPKLELLLGFESPNRYYLDQLIELNGAYCERAEPYLDSIIQLEAEWTAYAKNLRAHKLEVLKNANDSLTTQELSEVVSHMYYANDLRISNSYVDSIEIELKARFILDTSSVEPNFYGCLGAIQAFKEYAKRNEYCPVCDERIEQLEIKYEAWKSHFEVPDSLLDPVSKSLWYYQKGLLVEALDWSNKSIEIDSLSQEARTWLCRGYYLKDLYKAQYRAGGTKADSVRYGAIEAYMTAKKLDTADEFAIDILQSSRFLASTMYNDAAKALDQSKFDQAQDHYEFYKQFTMLVNPAMDFTGHDVEYYLYEASKRTIQLEDKNEPYDTIQAKYIDSLYVEVLKMAPTNISAQYNLKTHRINDGDRRREFLSSLEKENALNKAESARRHTQLWAMGGGLLLMLLVAGVAYRAYRQKQKDNHLITAQKAEVERAHEQLEEKNKEITDSIIYAKRIQEAILPPLKLVKENLRESFILYKPKDIVAGDFYWMDTVEDTVIFAAADCTGHGVPGALVSVVCSNALNRAVREFGLTEPAKILDKTLEIVIERFEKSEEEVKDGMDIALCALNTKTNELQYAGANNPLWIITKGGELVETKATKQPVGKYWNPKPYVNHTMQLQQGDSVYVFSDGYPDQFGGPHGKKLKSKPFKEFLLSIQDQDMETQRKSIDDHFENWRGEIEQIDDVCVIGVKIF